MAIIYRAPEKPNIEKIKDKKTCFLCGSIDGGAAIQWQQMIEEALADEDIVIFNPRRLDFDPQAIYSEDNPYMIEQIEWELNQIESSDIVVFYFDPAGKAPITLYEMGLVSNRVFKGEKIGIVCCPKGYWKRANVIVNAMFYDFHIVESIDDLVNLVKDIK